jgi:hypothetical protein
MSIPLYNISDIPYISQLSTFFGIFVKTDKSKKNSCVLQRPVWTELLKLVYKQLSA